jgi:(p)ppGpp synthase/HD superfamily hydrolase
MLLTDRRESEPFTAAAADALAARLLGDLRTKLGGLHIEHARRVAERVRPTGDDRTVAAALLHDVVEKGESSLADLLAVVRDERVVQLVDILTRRRAESEEEYLSRCAADPVALAIKRADLADKHFHGDAQVDRNTAQRLGREAQQRLELLDRLARNRGGADSCAESVRVKTFHPAEGGAHSPGEPEDDIGNAAERSMDERRQEWTSGTSSGCWCGASSS